MKILFMGTSQFAIESVNTILSEPEMNVLGVVTQPDRPKGRGRAVGPPDVKSGLKDKQVPIFQPENVNEDSFLASVKSMGIDLIVVVSFGQILGRKLLQIPGFGCINAHASLLPKYRGPAPIFWAIANGEKVAGVTIIKMDGGIDTGHIILRKSFDILEEDDSGVLSEKLSNTSARLLKEAIVLIKNGKVTFTPQDGGLATYAPKLEKKHLQIDWSRKAGEIHNLVRALSPYPYAYTYISRQDIRLLTNEDDASKEGWTRLKICKTEVGGDGGCPLAGAHEVGAGQIPPPGRILKLDGSQGFTVSTGEGSLLVKVVQPESGKVIPASDFIRGFKS